MTKYTPYTLFLKLGEEISHLLDQVSITSEKAEIVCIVEKPEQEPYEIVMGTKSLTLPTHIDNVRISWEEK